MRMLPIALFAVACGASGELAYQGEVTVFSDFGPGGNTSAPAILDSFGPGDPFEVWIEWTAKDPKQDSPDGTPTDFDTRYRADVVDLTIGEYRLSATDAILEIGPFAIAKTAVSGDFNTASVTLLQADANVEGDPSLLEPDSASAFFWVEDGDYVLVESTR